jgi:hypothetical protein
MNFVGILLALSIVIALFGSYGAMKNTKNTKDFRAKGKDRFQSPRLRFVDRKQFADLYESEAMCQNWASGTIPRRRAPSEHWCHSGDTTASR